MARTTLDACVGSQNEAQPETRPADGSIEVLIDCWRVLSAGKTMTESERFRRGQSIG